MDEEKLTKKEKRALAKEKKQEERQKSQNFQKVKKLTTIVLVVLALGFGAFKFWKWINTPTGTSVGSLELTESDHVKGNPEAAKTIIEYSDFQCPACAAYSPLVNQVVDSRNDVKLVYRYFPLSQIHPNAVAASKAAEAAGKQDKFWEMHDLLFDKQSDWESLGNPKDKFVEYASELGLDTDKFKVDLGSNEVESKVFADLGQANQMKLNSTPTFFINGEKVRFPVSVEGINQLIDKSN